MKKKEREEFMSVLETLHSEAQAMTRKQTELESQLRT
jgi:hypothetical protein